MSFEPRDDCGRNPATSAGCFPEKPDPPPAERGSPRTVDSKQLGSGKCATKSRKRPYGRSTLLLPRPDGMETLDLGKLVPEDEARLANLSNLVLRCARCVVVIGAGVSVSSGLPDFRSSDGIFQLLGKKHSRSIVNGRDLFDASLFKNETSTRMFFNFVAEFKELVNKASCTQTHRFLRKLDMTGQLLRCYTQNIDCLEEQAGLVTSWSKPSTSEDPEDKGIKEDDMTCARRLLPSLDGHDSPGAAARNVHNKRRKRSAGRTVQLEPPRAVQLHGTLANVVCTQCRTRRDFDAAVISAFKSGVLLECANCCENESVRFVAGLRSKGVGIMRPDVVLYNVFHPLGERIGDISASDIRKRPDLLLVMGTSLKIPGVRRLIKELSRAVHSRPGGRTALVNRDPPDTGLWESVFDYLILGDADTAVEVFEGRFDGLLRGPEKVFAGEKKDEDDVFQTPSVLPSINGRKSGSVAGDKFRTECSGKEANSSKKFGAVWPHPPCRPAVPGPSHLDDCPSAQKTIDGSFKARKKRKRLQV